MIVPRKVFLGKGDSGGEIFLSPSPFGKTVGQTARRLSLRGKVSTKSYLRSVEGRGTKESSCLRSWNGASARLRFSLSTPRMHTLRWRALSQRKIGRSWLPFLSLPLVPSFRADASCDPLPLGGWFKLGSLGSRAPSQLRSCSLRQRSPGAQVARNCLWRWVGRRAS